jgi:hypothetical protein
MGVVPTSHPADNYNRCRGIALGSGWLILFVHLLPDDIQM